jgi:hypothetical protein
MERMSPKYQMRLIDSIYNAIYNEYYTNVKAEYYIQKWQVTYYGGNHNFELYYFSDPTFIDLQKTLNGIDEETLIKIAIDLGVETPDYIPSVPIFRNTLKESYPTASVAFERALKAIEEEPDTAIGLANSALESIVKEILKDNRIKTKKKNSSDTLYKLTSDLLKEFKLYPDSNMPDEIKSLGSGLMNVCHAIENLRSDKTSFHGHTNEDYIINDTMYAYFVVNSVCTIGNFIDSFYKKKYPPTNISTPSCDNEYIDDNSDDLPF